jgi:hypothetical protein
MRPAVGAAVTLIPSRRRLSCYPRTVDSTSLNLKQVQRLLGTVRRQEHYLAKLTGRMHQKHFPHNDPMKMAADEAEKAMGQLVDVLRRMEEQQSSPPY